MALKESRLEVKLSDKLKKDFKAMCDDSEIDMSDKVRELIANAVRNHKRNEKKATEKEVN